ncbi:protein of unknown function [Methylocaldum szegediense]|uniref:Uncharacterized protein n=1 Tax=Methylocaldum szegediense TaxID=73780 RepID=A0ABN8X5R0_9GAMM|nr:protein of unknown function [Methylocaldum szegediense]
MRHILSVAPGRFSESQTSSSLSLKILSGPGVFCPGPKYFDSCSYACLTEVSHSLKFLREKMLRNRRKPFDVCLDKV